MDIQHMVRRQIWTNFFPWKTLYFSYRGHQILQFAQKCVNFFDERRLLSSVTIRFDQYKSKNLFGSSLFLINELQTNKYKNFFTPKLQQRYTFISLQMSSL